MKDPPKLSQSHLRRSETRTSRRRFSFELTVPQLAAGLAGLVLCLSWMFVFGILVGRGVPLAGPDETSFRAEFFRFLGLDRDVSQPRQNVARTWHEPKEMLESLTYYEELAQKGAKSSSSSLTQQPEASRNAAALEDPVKEAKTSAATVTPPAEPAALAQREKSPPPKTPRPPSAVETPGEHFTLLVASLKDMENAQRLIEQLKSKGYEPRLHSINLNGGGRWNRVLIGSCSRLQQEGAHGRTGHQGIQRVEPAHNNSSRHLLPVHATLPADPYREFSRSIRQTSMSRGLTNQT